jgi:ubiquinone/menaquinone biosynthesis C-methylase UbiE
MSGLPDYIPLLSAYHEAQRATIGSAFHKLNLRPKTAVLDVPCGDGFYASLLADRVGPHGRVVALDASRELLKLAEESFGGEQIEFALADAYQLPYADETFDLVWCAQSLVSLRDPPSALNEMRRVLKCGGSVGVWENDALHHTLVPWPPRLEIALNEAERAAEADKDQSRDAVFAGRYVRRYLREANFENIVRHTLATDHQQCREPAARRLMELWLASQSEKLRPHLNAENKVLFDRLASPDSPGYLLDQPDFELALIDILTVAERD